MKETTHILDFEDNEKTSFTIEYVEGFLQRAKKLGATHVSIASMEGDFSMYAERAATPQEIEEDNKFWDDWKKRNPYKYKFIPLI